jgi:hypothetical protein
MRRMFPSYKFTNLFKHTSAQNKTPGTQSFIAQRMLHASRDNHPQRIL